MVRLKEKEREFLENPYVGILTEHRPDGSLHTTPVWVDADGRAEVSFNTARGRVKEKDIARDPRVSLSMEGTATNALGLREYLVVHGTARIVEGGGPELLQRLAHTYLGPGVKFPPMDDPPPGVVVHIAAERLGGVGPWR